MKIACQLDYRPILINQGQPIHAVQKLTAEKCSSTSRTPHTIARRISGLQSPNGATHSSLGQSPRKTGPNGQAL